MGLGEVGTQADGGAAVFQGLVELPVLQEHLTEVAPRLGEVGVELHGLAKMGQGPGGVARQAQGVAEVVASHGEVRLQAQRGAELLRGGLGLPLFQQRQAEVVGRLGIVGLQSQRGATAVDGPVYLAHRAIDQGQVGVVGRGGGIRGDGTTDPFGGPHGVALLVGDDARASAGRQRGPVGRPGDDDTILAAWSSSPRWCCWMASANSSGMERLPGNGQGVLIRSAAVGLRTLSFVAQRYHGGNRGGLSPRTIWTDARRPRRIERPSRAFPCGA